MFAPLQPFANRFWPMFINSWESQHIIWQMFAPLQPFFWGSLLRLTSSWPPARCWWVASRSSCSVLQREQWQSQQLRYPMQRAYLHTKNSNMLLRNLQDRSFKFSFRRTWEPLFFIGFTRFSVECAGSEFQVLLQENLKTFVFHWFYKVFCEICRIGVSSSP